MIPDLRQYFLRLRVRAVLRRNFGKGLDIRTGWAEQTCSRACDYLDALRLARLTLDGERERAIIAAIRYHQQIAREVDALCASVSAPRRNAR